MKADKATVAHLLGICLEEQRQFTLNEIVARVIEERPEKIVQFAEAWDELVRLEFVRLLKPGRPSVYEVTARSGPVEFAVPSHHAHETRFPH